MNFVLWFGCMGGGSMPGGGIVYCAGWLRLLGAAVRYSVRTAAGRWVVSAECQQLVTSLCLRVRHSASPTLGLSPQPSTARLYPVSRCMVLPPLPPPPLLLLLRRRRWRRRRRLQPRVWFWRRCHSPCAFCFDLACIPTLTAAVVCCLRRAGERQAPGRHPPSGPTAQTGAKTMPRPPGRCLGRTPKPGHRRRFQPGAALRRRSATCSPAGCGC